MRYPAGPPTTLATLPPGVPGVRMTLLKMRTLVRRGKLNPAVRMLALELTQHLDQKDYSGEARALQAFVRDRIRYVGDIHEVETLQSPDLTLQLRAGDCDDKSILLATLLETINHPTKFVAVGSEPGFYSHVYLETQIGGRWYTMETTEPVPAGWEPIGHNDPIVVHN